MDVHGIPDRSTNCYGKRMAGTLEKEHDASHAGAQCGAMISYYNALSTNASSLLNPDARRNARR